jgi:hypothetical protein
MITQCAYALEFQSRHRAVSVNRDLSMQIAEKAKTLVQPLQQVASTETSKTKVFDGPGINIVQVGVLTVEGFEPANNGSSGERWTTKRSAQLVDMIGVTLL